MNYKCSLQRNQTRTSTRITIINYGAGMLKFPGKENKHKK